MKISNNKPLLCFFSGGPGLGSKSFSKLESLFQGTNIETLIIDSQKLDFSQEDIKSYENYLSKITKILSDYNERGLYLCGHSFGGIIAGDIATRQKLDIKGLIYASVPTLKESFKVVDSNYSSLMTEEMKKTGDLFSASPSNETLKNWFASYDELFFLKENIEMGKELILSDNVSYELFVNLRSSANQGEALSSKLKSIEIPKLFIHGSKDKLISSDVSRRESQLGGFKIVEIKNSGHFSIYENPEDVFKEIIEILPKGVK